MPTDKKGTRNGTETYYFGDGTNRGDRSSELASVLLAEVSRAAGTEARFNKSMRFFVIRYTAMPAVLVETGYLDSQTDGRLLEDPGHRQHFAEGVVRGIIRYLQQSGRMAALPEAEVKG
jgi:N-acetylmuramoyl-L-alanine amidase